MNSKVEHETDLREQWYMLGHVDGAASRDAEISRLRWQCDLWFFCANNRGKRPSDYYAAATDRLWSEASK